MRPDVWPSPAVQGPSALSRGRGRCEPPEYHPLPSSEDGGTRGGGVGGEGPAQRCTHGAFYPLQGDPGIAGPPGAKVRPSSQAQAVSGASPARVGWGPRLGPLGPGPGPSRPPG